MSKTNIEWTHWPGTIGETWNVTTGCNKVDRGCKHCYAEVMHRRLQKMQPDKYDSPFLDGAVEHPEMIEVPFTWKKPRTVFVNSMSDLFHVKVSFEFLYKVFTTMDVTRLHTYLVLTKRPERAVEFWAWMAGQVPGWRCPENVLVGTSINDQLSADNRIKFLLQLTGCRRFLSYEPATGPADLTRLHISSVCLGESSRDGELSYYLDALRGTRWSEVTVDGEVQQQNMLDWDVPRLHWVITGGESGPKAVPAHPDWFRHVRDACRVAGVPYFFKQWGLWEPVSYNREGIPFVSFAVGKNEYVFNDPYFRPQNMRKAAHKNGNLLDGETHLNFPNR